MMPNGLAPVLVETIFDTIQEINETVLNALFGVVFFGAVVVPLGGAVVLIFQGDWQTLRGHCISQGLPSTLSARSC